MCLRNTDGIIRSRKLKRRIDSRSLWTMFAFFMSAIVRNFKPKIYDLIERCTIRFGQPSVRGEREKLIAAGRAS